MSWKCFFGTHSFKEQDAYLTRINDNNITPIKLKIERCKDCKSVAILTQLNLEIRYK